MIARALGALVLATSVAVVTPWSPEEAADEQAGLGAMAAAAAEQQDPVARLHTAIEQATRAHVPGAAGSDWVLQRLERSEGMFGDSERIVAFGVITTPGNADTQVRLSGRYDPSTGELDRVAYRLQDTQRPGARTASQDTTWSVQQGVQYALSQVLPDEKVVFALDSAQSTRVEGGGRRFDGSGIGSWGNGDARFISFTMTLSATGELVEFDYGMPLEGEPSPEGPQVAAN